MATIVFTGIFGYAYLAYTTFFQNNSHNQNNKDIRNH